MRYGEVAEAAWAWVLEQVQWDHDGPWIPEYGGGGKPDEYINGLHSGIGGLAHVLAEIRLSRAWTADEQHLATAVANRVPTAIPAGTPLTYFDRLGSSLGGLTALQPPRSRAAG